MVEGIFYIYYKIKESIKNAFSAIGNFFLKILTPESGISSMRFWRLVVLTCMVIDWMVSVAVYYNWYPSWELVTLIGGFFGFSILEKGIERQESKYSGIINKTKELFNKNINKEEKYIDEVPYPPEEQ